MAVMSLPRDVGNAIRYGLGAPRFCQTIFIDPQKVTHSSLAGFTREDSGRVVGGDWDRAFRPIEDATKIAIIYKRITYGVTWEQAGAYEHMMKLIEKSPGIDGCFTLADVVERCQKLDDLILQLQNGGTFKKRSWSDGFREDDGVYVHIGRNGELLFGNGGSHRLVIAQKLGVKVIPAQVGVVHESFILRGDYLALRSRG
jgi:hypothetical protein